MNTLLLLTLGAVALCVKPVRKALGIGAVSLDKMNIHRLIAICEEIADRLETNVSVSNYPEYGYSMIEFYTDKFGGYYVCLHYDYNTGVVTNWYGEEYAYEVHTVDQLEKLVERELYRELEGRYGEDFAEEHFGFLRKNGRIGGTGSMRISSSILNKAKKLFDAYDSAVEIERDHEDRVDAIYENFEAQGIDPYADENEKLVIDALYSAGLTDQNGMTNVSVNRSKARKELLDFINDKLIAKFPFSASDKNALKNTYSVVLQNRLLDISRNFIEKAIEHNRKIREILNS